ncbi:hypothetical protein JHK85_014772 [Glycine max]|nr:hypothetical protein JHK85_014772 [Glycine max]
MGDLENALGLQSVSEMTVSSASMAMPSGAANPFLSSSAWDPLVPLSQTFGGSLVVSHSEFAHSAYPFVMNCDSHFVQYVSDSNFEHMALKVPSFGQTGCYDIDNNIGYLPNHNPSNESGIERSQLNNEKSKHEDSTSEEGAAPGEHKRKRGLYYNVTFSSNKNAEGETLQNSSGKSCDDVKEQCEKKPKFAQNSAANLCGKQLLKHKKDDSESEEAPKENFIHVRTRRGQATNSHNLAERITGKAVMLDEIINYVQLLQQQVERLPETRRSATGGPNHGVAGRNAGRTMAADGGSGRKRRKKHWQKYNEDKSLRDSL